MYTVIDILDKVVEIAEKSIERYRMFQKNLTMSEHARLVAGVFIREEERYINIYKKMKEETLDLEDIQIDFDIYDTISKLISAFKRDISYLEVNDVRQILMQTMDFKQRHLALVIRIQGLLVRTNEDMETNSYKILTRIINEEKEHIEILEAFL